jgi:cytochrome c-type biogenesis protein CcmE
VGLSLLAFRQDVNFFVTPSSLAQQDAPGRTLRLGGLVQAGSVARVNEGGESVAKFRVTDGVKSVEVTYHGVLPDLFREGQSVVTLGTLDSSGGFQASEVLAKHDENYMSKDVADALKKLGWNPASGKPPPPAATWSALVAKSKSSS